MKRATAFLLGLCLVVALTALGLYLASAQPAEAAALLERALGGNAALARGAPLLGVPRAQLAVLALPFSLLALFGLYSLASIAHGLASFEDISAAKLELDREVLEVRAELKARGVRSIAELRAAAAAGAGGGGGGGAGGSTSAKKAR